MKLAENPFAAGKPVTSRPAFVGRKAAVHTVVELLRAREHGVVTIAGHPGIGKTSLLRVLRDELPAHGPFHAVYIDLSRRAKFPLAAAVRSVAATIARALGLPKPGLPGPSDLVFRDTWLPATLNSLISGGIGATLVLLVDNYNAPEDASQADNIVALATYLRELVAATPRLLAITTNNLFDPSGDPRAELIGTHTITLAPLDAEEAYTLIRTSQAAGTLRWKPRAAATVWALARGYPALLQRLCAEVWEELHYYDPASTPDATDADVTAAVEKTLEASQSLAASLWSSLPPLARVFVSALAEQPATSGGVALKSVYQQLRQGGVRDLDKQLDDLPGALAQWGVLELLEHGSFRFQYPLLGRLIAHHYPLHQVRAELDHTKPEAETHYRAALNLTHDLDHHPVDEVVEHLDKALALNPNHAGSIALLADIYARRGQTEEALALLERLYEIQPTAARPQIVELLLNSAQAETDPDERLALHTQVLEYAPNHREARTVVESTWRERGAKAEAAGAIPQAIHAYTKAGLSEEVERVQLEARETEVKRALENVAALEASRDFATARDHLEKLATRYPHARDNWQAQLDRLARLHDLNEGYEGGLAALRIGDYRRAYEVLSEIARADPEFEDVAQALEQAKQALRKAQKPAQRRQEPTLQPTQAPPKTEDAGYAPIEDPGPSSTGVWLLLAVVVVIVAGVLVFGQGKPQPTRADHEPVELSGSPNQPDPSSATPSPPQPEPEPESGGSDEVVPAEIQPEPIDPGPAPAMPEAYATTIEQARVALFELDPAQINQGVSELVAHLFQADSMHPLIRAELQLMEAELLLTRALLIEFERSVRIKETVATSEARVTDDTLRALSLMAGLRGLVLPPALAAQQQRLVVYASLIRGEAPPAIEDQPLIQVLADAADLWRNPASVELPFLTGLIQRLPPLRGDPPSALALVLEALAKYRVYRIEQTGSSKASARKLVLQLRRRNEKLTLLHTLHRGLTLPANPRNIGDVIRRIRLDVLSNCVIPPGQARPEVTIKVDAPAGRAKLVEVVPRAAHLEDFRTCAEKRIAAMEYPAFTPTNPNTRRKLTL